MSQPAEQPSTQPAAVMAEIMNVDGTDLTVRPILVSDADGLNRMFGRLSRKSVYFRFFSPMKRMSDALAHRLAVVDYNDRFALVATTTKPGNKERIVGVARYDRVPNTEVAETAVAVIDEYLIFGGFNRASPTYTWTIFMYDQAFKQGLWRQGYAASIGMIGAIAMMIVMVFLLRIFRPRG